MLFMHIIRLGGPKHSARILHSATVCAVRPVAWRPLLKRRTAPPASAWRRFSEKPHVSVTRWPSAPAPRSTASRCHAVETQIVGPMCDRRIANADDSCCCPDRPVAARHGHYLHTRRAAAYSARRRGYSATSAGYSGTPDLARPTRLASAWPTTARTGRRGDLGVINLRL